MDVILNTESQSFEKCCVDFILQNDIFMFSTQNQNSQ